MDVIDEILARITPVEWTLTDRKMGVASLIADTMKARSLSHSDFAHKMGKKTADISFMLSGNYNYTIEELTQIEYVLDTKLFFSSALDWWHPEPIKPPYATHTVELSMAAEP